MRNWGLQDFSCFGSSLAGSQSHSGAYKLQKELMWFWNLNPKIWKLVFLLPNIFDLSSLSFLSFLWALILLIVQSLSSQFCREFSKGTEHSCVMKQLLQFPEMRRTSIGYLGFCFHPMFYFDNMKTAWKECLGLTLFKLLPPCSLSNVAPDSFLLACWKVCSLMKKVLGRLLPFFLNPVPRYWTKCSDYWSSS